MSRVRSLEKELRHLAQLKQQEEAQLLRAEDPSHRSLPQDGPDSHSRYTGSASCSDRDGEASESSSSSCSGDLEPGSRPGPALRPNRNSTASLLFSSPNSTGSRFDLLMDGGGSCRRCEVRQASTAVRHKGKVPHTAGSTSQNCGGAAEGHANRRDRREVTSGGDSEGTVPNVGVAGCVSSPPPPPLIVDPSVTPISIPSQPPFRRLQQQPFSHILVCDFEATCESGSVSYPHEIIEFPVVVLDTVSLQVVAEFHSYVRPVKNPKLTPFCTQLTGITQEMVDSADPLPAVVERFNEWLREVLYPICRAWRAHYAQGEPTPGNGENPSEHCTLLAKNLNNEKKRFVYDDRTELSRAVVSEERMVCFATDGPWDMRRFMHECSVLRDGVDFPPVCYRYINVRHSFCEYFKSRQIKLTHMLKKLHMSFEGQRHSGIDDTRNIARVLAELFARGYRVHHVSCIKYAHRGDAFLASNVAAQELLAEYGEDDDDNAANRNRARNHTQLHGTGRGAHRQNIPRNLQHKVSARDGKKKRK